MKAKTQSTSKSTEFLFPRPASFGKGPVLELESHHLGEPRKLAIGKIDGKFWTVIFTLRGMTIRMISARRSRDNEKKLYYEKDHTQES